MIFVTIYTHTTFAATALLLTFCLGKAVYLTFRSSRLSEAPLGANGSDSSTDGVAATQLTGASAVLGSPQVEQLAGQATELTCLIDLTKFTHRQLRAIAKYHQISRYSRLTKSELVTALT